MKILKITAAIVVIAATAAAAYGYQFTGHRAKFDLCAFANRLDTCTAFDQEYGEPLGWTKMNRAILGETAGRCRVRFDTLGPQVLSCAFLMQDIPAIAQEFRKQADGIEFWGSAKLRYDSANPDPLTRLFNGDACALSA